ncbi:MAG TPA: tetratricopeptide repeat protein [Candidatus Obscuribacterales bacterium]
MTTEKPDLIQRFYHLGKDAFERGQYRTAIEHLEKATALVNRISPLGGEVQMWLVTAYEAAGLREEAIALCETLSRHPDYTTSKQGRRLLYILKAPRLKTRPEWITPIPDLGNLEEGSSTAGQGVSSYRPSSSRPSKPRPKPEPEPIDWSQVKTEDNRFVWVALGAIALTLGGLAWFI